MNDNFRWWALIGVSLLAFTAFLDVTIVNTALPFIQKSLFASVLQLQWVSNIYSMLLSMTMIAAGKFADLFGRKKVFFIGALLFAIAAIGAALSPSMDVLIFARGVQGLGASMIFISSTSLLTDIFPQHEHAKAVGIYTGITGAGLTLGPAIGGILVGLLGWRWVFWINIPIVILGLAMCTFSMRTSKLPPARTVHIDWIGLILLIVGLGSFTYGIISGAERGFTEIDTLVTLILGIVALIILVIVEEKIEHPLLEIKIFSKKLILLSTFSCAVAGIVTYVFMFFDPLYLKIIRELSPYTIGFLIAIIPVAQVVVSILFSSLLKRFGIANLLTASVVAAFIAACLHLFISPNFPLAWLAVPFFLLGINWGFSNTCLMTAVNQSIPEEKAGKAIGTIATFWNMAGGIFLAISSAIFHVSEKSAFLKNLKESSIELTRGQINALQKMLEQATGSVSEITKVVGEQSDQVFTFFENSFMSAFHLVIAVNTAIIFLAVFAALWIRNRHSKEA